MQRRNARGFTLIEVMVVVAILGILGSIALASYTNQVMRSNRSDAVAALNDTAQRLQRCYTTYSSYDNDSCGVYDDLDNGALESSEGLYEISFEAGSNSATTYTLLATPIEAPQIDDDECDDMTLSHTGRRSPDACW